jgi:TonB family protein
MNRLQKKCAITIVGFHLLLLVVLIVGPGFFAPKPKADDLQVLDVIPANLIDAAFNSGVRNAQPPPPAPAVTPLPPQPAVAPPKPEIPEPVKPVVKALAPEPKPVESQKPKIEINTQLVTRTAPKNPPTTDNSRQNARAIKNVLQSLRHNLSSGTTIDLPGNSSVAYANYAAVVKSVYEQAWQPPDDAANDEANTKVTVTIANDGTVISARILAPSGDVGVDASVQRTLDRVTFIAPFPEGAKEKERTYTINFNLKAKRLLE